MHSECFFDSCSSRNGAAMYIYSCECSIVQHRFCSHKCFAKSGQISFCQLKTSSTEYLNYVDESSVCGCGKLSKSDLFYSLCGKMRFSSNNISKNCASENAAFFIATSNFQNLNYSTIESNNASNYRMILLNWGVKYNIENSNILKNFQAKSDFGVISIYGRLTLNECAILDDNGNGKTFYIHEDSYVTVKNSFYDDLTSNFIEIMIDNCMRASKYNSLSYYDSYLCVALHPINIKNINLSNNIKCSMKDFYGRDFIRKLLYEFVVLICK
ncbi:hypothetical protein TVAG_158880 [Trichomonas vaginalis G3]|uniref:Uncharacterized protein n=1 Tax=Trichomonas vaginalis (strain ATCC PRA-98 / G3) TaxID=412133 RepID=A2E6R7_TRIV3|nr:hypothetical protein TVAGG3_0779320 [Trichomonas vaginalis G3]EAY11661.1 hypothetical protein TVAG_158880 [Trichomonas vaginalis G3]KAI5494934.1 hypothetical protein TVAGG3_0779320 [Trichomonas vaginalis G3]|eukprot:XP_001323884.1 hypothetical protein [Trichomonas vaginalis G3]